MYLLKSQQNCINTQFKCICILLRSLNYRNDIVLTLMKNLNMLISLNWTLRLQHSPLQHSSLNQIWQFKKEQKLMFEKVKVRK